jgi:alkanesulfonate monooxygenase SsuD/methylene tetrahydromethanopterin reductase-like flavin-dependent oxidoreductase (luciferase family)
MHISIFLGPFARGPRDDRPLIDWCLRGAEQAAADGFAMVTFGEQHFNNYEPYCNPLLMGARLAPVLGDAWFATTVLPLPYHNPIRLAEDLNALDQLLSGKLIAGMSAGRIGFSPDFENFGLDPKQQRAIYAEKMAALKTLWTHTQDDGPLAFTGDWVKGGMHGRLMPVSYRSPHPHIAIGSNTDATVRQAGVDGNILFLGPCPLEDAAAKLDLFRHGLVAGGHDPAVIEDRIDKSMVHHQFVVADTDDAAWAQIERMMPFHPLMDRREDKRSFRQMQDDGLSEKPGTPVEKANELVVRGWMVAGSPQTVIDVIKAHGDAGLKMVHTRFGFGPYNPELWDRNYKMFVGSVLPHVDCTPLEAVRPHEMQPAVIAGAAPIGGPPTQSMGIAAKDSPEPARRTG